jgi:hypothetical protein
VPNTKLVPNIQIYLHKNFHNFLRSLSIFPRIKFILCCMKNNLGKRECFSALWTRPAANRPNTLRKPGLLVLSVHHNCVVPERRSNPPVGLSLSVRAPPVRSFFPNFSLARAWPLRRRNPIAVASSCHLPPLRQCPFASSHRLVPSRGRAVASPCYAGAHATAAIAAEPPQCPGLSAHRQGYAAPHRLPHQNVRLSRPLMRHLARMFVATWRTHAAAWPPLRSTPSPTQRGQPHPAKARSFASSHRLLPL